MHPASKPKRTCTDIRRINKAGNHEENGMMKLAAPVFLALLWISSANAASEQTVLQLSKLVDGTVVSQIRIISNQIDPNTTSIDDTIRVLRNGAVVKGYAEQAATIARARRAYSYDHFTKGVIDKPGFAVCRLGGPEVGWIMETRYLTYGSNHAITGSKMRPVLSRAENCLFARQVHPVKRSAHVAAAIAFGQLRAILEQGD